jgi:hypothetical protein
MAVGHLPYEYVGLALLGKGWQCHPSRAPILAGSTGLFHTSSIRKSKNIWIFKVALILKTLFYLLERHGSDLELAPPTTAGDECRTPISWAVDPALAALLPYLCHTLKKDQRDRMDYEKS